MARYECRFFLLSFVCFLISIGEGSKKGHLSKEKMAEIQSIIDKDRRMLEEKKDMAEEERNKVKNELESKETQLKTYQ